MAGIGIISNPYSKMNRKNPIIFEELREVVGVSGVVAETTSIGDIGRVAGEFADRGVEILAINGGDGTLHYTLSHFTRVYRERNLPLPKVALLRGGTMNTISKALDTMKGRPVSILRRVAEKYRADEEFEIVPAHSVEINGFEQAFLFGNGLAANFIDAYYDGKRTGPLKGLYVLVRMILSIFVWGRYARRLFGKVRAVIEADGERCEAEAFVVVMASGVRELGLGCTPFYRTHERPGHFQIEAIIKSPLWFVTQVPRLWRALPLRTGVFDRLCRVARIRVKEKYKYMVDGEIKDGPDEFVLRAGPLFSFIKS